MKKEFIALLTIAIAIFGSPILAEAEVFNFPEPVIVEENPVSIFFTTYEGVFDAAECNGFRSQPGDPYNPLDEGDVLFVIFLGAIRGKISKTLPQLISELLRTFRNMELVRVYDSGLQKMEICASMKECASITTVL